MRIIAVASLAGILVCLSGCAGVVSLHPLAEPNGKNTVFDPALLGTWEEVKPSDNGQKVQYSVGRAESGYSVVAHDGKETIKGTMRLMKAGDRYLLDVLSASDGAPPPVHLFFRLRLDGDKAWVAEMDSRWLRDQIESSGRPRHEVAEDDRLVLTAPPAELRRYLLPYAEDQRAFGDETELRRVAGKAVSQ